MPIHLHIYFTPLTSQVEELSLQPTDHLCTSREITQDTQHRTYRPQPPKQVYFPLAPSHTDKYSRKWTQSEWTTRAPPRSLRHLQLHEHRIKQGVLNGSIPSAAWDTVCTSNAGKLGGPFIPTALQSNKVFPLADGYPTPVTTVALLKHKLREEACTVHIVLALAHQSLLSGGQFTDSGYISICDGDEVNIYDEKTANITVSEKTVLKGWRCPTTKLWRIPLQESISNANTDTLLLNGPTGNKAL